MYIEVKKGYKNRDTLIVENASIIHRNLSGRKSEFNRNGKRSFSIPLDEENANMLQAHGFNVKFRPQEDGSVFCYLSVSVNYSNVPPKICRISNGKMLILDEDTVGTLDSADIENVDMVINAVYWDIQGRSGVKCYVSEMYVTVSNGYFDDKYAGYEFVSRIRRDNEDEEF